MNLSSIGPSAKPAARASELNSLLIIFPCRLFLSRVNLVSLYPQITFALFNSVRQFGSSLKSEMEAKHTNCLFLPGRLLQFGIWIPRALEWYQTFFQGNSAWITSLSFAHQLELGHQPNLAYQICCAVKIALCSIHERYRICCWSLLLNLAIMLNSVKQLFLTLSWPM